ncbi:MAG TPA: hypothetical protein VMM38_06500 [Aridibacter sp.]|nr:hypothetical protein [Aridibacter sp.]
MGAKFSYYTKKLHRYFGVFIGIQFLLWTVGGFYFSWTNITEIRGEHLLAEKDRLASAEDLASPGQAAEDLVRSGQAKGISNVRLAFLLDKPVYEIALETENGSKTVLADAGTGELRGPIEKQEAVAISDAALAKTSQVVDVRLITEKEVGGHHEYRGKPLPAWAVTYSEPSGLVVYVAKDTGRVESLRTPSWRVFDLFWLFHTLDLYGRDDINNWVLRAFSVLGLVTIFSGYFLFFITSPWFRRKRDRDS